MKYKFLLGAGALLAVTAGVQAIAADAGIRPGEYETTTRLVSAEMPGLPASAKQKMLAKVETKKQCITAEQVKSGIMSSKNCRASQSSMAGGKITHVAQCMGGKTERLTGTYTPNSFNITLATAAAGTSMTFNHVGRWIGECTGSEE